MTGELSDIFPSRDAGVAALLDEIAERFPAENLIYAGPVRFRRDRAGRAAEQRMSPPPTGTRPPRLVAKLAGDALFVDMGSTTTDIIAVEDGRRRQRRLHRRRAAADRRTGLYRLHPDLPVRRRLVGAGARQADAADERVFRLDRRRAPDPRACSTRRTTGTLPPTARKRPSPARSRGWRAWSGATPPI